MWIMSARYTLLACGALGMATVFGACTAEVSAPAKVAALTRSLEDACADVPADLVGDVLAIMSSTEPLDPAEPQAYGGTSCGGFVFEFLNPDEEPLHGAWVQASGQSRSASDALSESRCAARVLQADYWGYKDKAWTKLAAAEASADTVPNADQGGGSCALDALMLHEGSFEKLRIVARVTQDAQTYPMHACLW